MVSRTVRIVPPSGHFLMGTSGVVESVDIIDDHIFPRPRRDAIRTSMCSCDFLPGEVAGDNRPFSQPRIDNLIKLRNRKIGNSFRSDIIQRNKPILADYLHDAVVAIAQMIDDFTPSNESASSAQVRACCRIDDR